MNNKVLINPASPLRILDTRLHADPSRVVLRPFHLGWQAQSAPGDRALRLVEDVLALSEPQVAVEYAKVLSDFGTRHWQTEEMFAERFEAVEDSLGLAGKGYSDTRKRLIGAYFCHEYSYAARR